MTKSSSITLSPSDRLTVIGKTGSGKTVASVAIASLLVPMDHPRWQLWWLDSKLDPKDGKMLREWGFGLKGSARKHIRLDPAHGDPSAQAQAFCDAALKRRNVLLVADEYKHITVSARRAGPGIEGVHLRGRGLNVGMLGQTQEPCDIPRQLLSQASHVFLFDLTYPRDIKYAKEMFPGYERPKHEHGFFYAYIDGDATWRYYPSIAQWHNMVTGANQATG